MSKLWYLSIDTTLSINKKKIDFLLPLKGEGYGWIAALFYNLLDGYKSGYFFGEINNIELFYIFCQFRFISMRERDFKWNNLKKLTILGKIYFIVNEYLIYYIYTEKTLTSFLQN